MNVDQVLQFGFPDLQLIAVGGSAGGIDAMGRLLLRIPREFPVPIVAVIHIAAQAKSAWHLVFPKAAVSIREAEDKERLSKGTVYFAPPGYHLLVDGGGTASLSLDLPVSMARPSIDVLFESVAWAYRQGALAIVLSGANSDGARGLARVRAQGGRAWVQDPNSAQVPAMPRAALGQVPDASVLTVERMTEMLSQLPRRGSHE